MFTQRQSVGKLAAVSSRRRLVLGAACAACSATLRMAPAYTQQRPGRPLKIVVGASPGGAADIVARTVAEGLAKNLGQAVVVDNKPGGLGAIGMDNFLATPRDGYTFTVVVNAMATEIPYTVKPKYDQIRSSRMRGHKHPDLATEFQGDFAGRLPDEAVPRSMTTEKFCNSGRFFAARDSCQAQP